MKDHRVRKVRKAPRVNEELPVLRANAVLKAPKVLRESLELMVLREFRENKVPPALRESKVLWDKPVNVASLEIAVQSVSKARRAETEWTVFKALKAQPVLKDKRAHVV